MKCICTTVLNETQKQDIQALAAACCLAEPVHLSAPVEDGLEYFLGYEDETLVSMVFLFFPEESVCECGAYTLPVKRQMGYFSELLTMALAFVETYKEEREAEVDFCFLTDRNSLAATAVLKTLEAEYWYSEYTMSLKLPAPVTADAAVSEGAPLSITEEEPNLYTASLDGRPIGVCMIIPKGDTVYFYGFEIKRAFRRKGYGRQFLTDMIRLLSADYRQITLQVSSLNTPALELYKKTGFRTSETLSYYLYEPMS